MRNSINLFKIAQLFSFLVTFDEQVAVPDTGDPFLACKLEAWIHKMFHNFHFLESDMVFGIVNPSM